MQVRVSFSFKATLLWVFSFGLVLAQSARAENPQAAKAPCPATGQNGSTGNPTSLATAEKQNLENAKNQFSALFKKKAASTTAAANPCPPAANAGANPPTEVATLAPAAAPGPAPAQAFQSNARTPIPPTAPYTSSFIPPAPAGGLDPSKLPDIVGIHIGEPTAQVIAEVKKLFPLVKNDRGTILSGDLGESGFKYANSNGPPYISSLVDSKPYVEACQGQGCQGSDTVRAIFSGPPDTRLVQLDRTVDLGSKNLPTLATVRNALIQKYGQSFSESTGGGSNTLVWLIDEQGKPMPPSNASQNGCKGLISQQGFPMTGSVHVLDDYLGVGNTGVTQQDLDKVAKGPCGKIIWVQAQVGRGQNGTVSGFEVMIREFSVDLRDAFAAQNYLRQAGNAQANQQLKKAQQQAAPKF